MVEHPGSILYKQLRLLNISVTRAAEDLQIGRPNLSNILNGHTSITPPMAIRLEKYLGEQAETWLMRQMTYDLALLRRHASVKQVKHG